MQCRYALSLILLLGLYFSDVLESLELGKNPGLEVDGYSDFRCKNSPAINHLDTTFDDSEIRDCYPAGDGEEKAHSFLTVSLDGNWNRCIVSIYSDDNCKTNKTLAPVGKCVSSQTLRSYGFECQAPVSSTIHFVDPTKLASSSSSSVTLASSSLSSQTASHPSLQPSSNTSSGNGNNNGGLSTSGTIALGVVLPTVSIIVAIVFGIRMWNSGFPRRNKRESTEVTMQNLDGNEPALFKENDQSLSTGPGGPNPQPTGLSEPWISRTTTSYSEVPGNESPIYSPITGGYAEMPPDTNQTLSPMSSLRSPSPYNTNRASQVGISLNNNQPYYPQASGTADAFANSGNPLAISPIIREGRRHTAASHNTAELPAESRRNANPIPELSDVRYC